MTWRVRPSELLGIADPFVAYQLDTAAAIRYAVEKTAAGTGLPSSRGTIAPGERYEHRGDLTAYPPPEPPTRWRGDH